MSDELKEKQKSLQSAIRVLQNQKQEISTLQEKKRQFDTGEVSTAEESKTIRKKTLIDFILGKVTKKDVDSANEAVFKAEMTGKLDAEMAEALDDVLKNMAAQIPSLQNAVAAAKVKIWESIYESIKREVQSKVGDLPILAMAAGSRIVKQYQATLLDCFGTGEGANKSIHFEIIDEAAKKLAKGYGLDD